MTLKRRMKVYAIRRKGWIQLRAATSRPVQSIQSASSGNVTVKMTVYEGGEFIGAIPIDRQYMLFEYGSPTMRHGQLKRVTGAVVNILLDEDSRELILGDL